MKLSVLSNAFRNRFFLVTLLVPVYVALYKIYMRRVNEFGCFDDCFNITAGYFLLKGKTLYSQIFFNHQLLPAYLSAAIQLATRPINIYELILRHRQFILFFGFFSNMFLVWRFRWAGFFFVVFFEFTKFYIFGDRFLAEGMIVYPFVYLLGLVWETCQGKRVYSREVIGAAALTWFILFMREPYTLAALVVFALLLLGKFQTKVKAAAIATLFLLSITTFLTQPLPDYFYNVVTVNTNTVARSEIATTNLFGTGILKAFFYPVAVFLYGPWSNFKVFLAGLSIVFIALVGYYLFKKRYRAIAAMLFILGLSNLRLVTPGRTFYETFHLIPWYGMFIMLIFLMLRDLQVRNRMYSIAIATFLICLLGYISFARNSFLKEKVNPQESFITNYGVYLQIGEVVRKLSTSRDTLFLDGFDELIYWQAKRLSPYKYSWYTSFMPYIPRYSDARAEMFSESPPDFYYGTCPKEKNPARLLPEFVRNSYQNLYSLGNPTCLYVKKSKLSHISLKQWKAVKESLYEPPPVENP